MTDVPKSHEEFSSRFLSLYKDHLHTLAYMRNTTIDKIEIPSKKTIFNQLLNKEISGIRDDLITIKDYLERHYDDTDPDCAADLHSIDLLSAYLNNLETAGTNAQTQ